MARLLQKDHKQNRAKGKLFKMLRLLKFIFYLFIVAAIAFVGFAYLGPFLGVDFSAHMQTIELPLTLDIN
jgi:predicted MFS family arabinose efflux permease